MRVYAYMFFVCFSVCGRRAFACTYTCCAASYFDDEHTSPVYMYPQAKELELEKEKQTNEKLQVMSIGSPEILFCVSSFRQRKPALSLSHSPTH